MALASHPRRSAISRAASPSMTAISGPMTVTRWSRPAPSPSAWSRISALVNDGGADAVVALDYDLARLGWLPEQMRCHATRAFALYEGGASQAPARHRQPLHRPPPWLEAGSGSARPLRPAGRAPRAPDAGSLRWMANTRRPLGIVIAVWGCLIGAVLLASAPVLLALLVIAGAR